MRVYEMTSGSVIYADGRAVETGNKVNIRLTDGTLIPPANLRRPDGTSWPSEGVVTDEDSKVVVAWPGDGPYPDALYADTGRGSFIMLPIDLAGRTSVLEATAVRVNNDGALINPETGNVIPTGGGTVDPAVVTAAVSTAVGPALAGKANLNVVDPTVAPFGMVFDAVYRKGTIGGTLTQVTLTAAPPASRVGKSIAIERAGVQTNEPHVATITAVSGNVVTFTPAASRAVTDWVTIGTDNYAAWIAARNAVSKRGKIVFPRGLDMGGGERGHLFSTRGLYPRGYLTLDIDPSLDIIIRNPTNAHPIDSAAFPWGNLHANGLSSTAPSNVKLPAYAVGDLAAGATTATLPGGWSGIAVDDVIVVRGTAHDTTDADTDGHLNEFPDVAIVTAVTRIAGNVITWADPLPEDISDGASVVVIDPTKVTYGSGFFAFNPVNYWALRDFHITGGPVRVNAAFPVWGGCYYNCTAAPFVVAGPGTSYSTVPAWQGAMTLNAGARSSFAGFSGACTYTGVEPKLFTWGVDVGECDLTMVPGATAAYSAISLGEGARNVDLTGVRILLSDGWVQPTLNAVDIRKCSDIKAGFTVVSRGTINTLVAIEGGYSATNIARKIDTDGMLLRALGTTNRGIDIGADGDIGPENVKLRGVDFDGSVAFEPVRGVKGHVILGDNPRLIASSSNEDPVYQGNRIRFGYAMRGEIDRGDITIPGAYVTRTRVIHVDLYPGKQTVFVGPLPAGSYVEEVDVETVHPVTGEPAPWNGTATVVNIITEAAQPRTGSPQWVAANVPVGSAVDPLQVVRKGDDTYEGWQAGQRIQNESRLRLTAEAVGATTGYSRVKIVVSTGPAPF